MWRTVLILLVLAGFVAGGVYAYGPLVDYWKWRSRPQFRTAEVTKGSVVSVVNATGTIKPVLQVAVGSFVSGPVKEIHADFNSEVKKDELLAKIDPRLYQAAVDRDEAQLANRQADVDRAKAQLLQSERDEQRGILLRKENPEFIAQAEMDKLYFNRKALAAQVIVAETAVKQAKAQLETSQANLNYCKITSPVDGIVINRKIDEGQTVAASFQTPELFVIAPDMREKMHVHASVDEADIGQIRAAQTDGRKVHFTVDAYPALSFEGNIEEIRLNSTTTQNVVTYPVVIAASNPDLKLLPGMTASISFVVEERNDVVKIPNAALRYFPLAVHVREQDKPLIEGLRDQAEEDRDTVTQLRLSAEERATRQSARNKRHVWVEAEGGLRAVEVELGISDSRYTQLLKGELKPSDRVVTGLKAPDWGPAK